MAALQPLFGSVPDCLLRDVRDAGVQVHEIGTSQGGRRLHGLEVGPAGAPVVSVVAGAHPDEPAGPVAALALARAWSQTELGRRARLACVPIIDVDGTVAQAEWLYPWDGAAALGRYAAHRRRRLPGADREFAWPGAPWGGTVLPECAAAAAFLDACGGAVAHLTLHGMAVAEGAWFLLDQRSLADPGLWQACVALASDVGVGLHPFERRGDKGFRSAGPGFCTHPSGLAMRRTFLHQGDAVTAAGFGWSSMESAIARARGAGLPAPRCAVSEMPLFVVPGSAGGGVRAALAAAEATADPTAWLNTWLADRGGYAVPLERQIAVMTGLVHALGTAAVRERGAWGCA